MSSHSSVLRRVGHKGDEIVKTASKRVSPALNKAVVVSVGIHWNYIPENDIRTIQSACEELTHRLIQRALRRRG